MEACPSPPRPKALHPTPPEWNGEEREPFLEQEFGTAGKTASRSECQALAPAPLQVAAPC